ncbi:MAG: hypothetical protein V2A61_08170 [Calditrichota bacterium]
MLTRLHYQDDLFIVTECSVCGVPMAVLRAHHPKFQPQEQELLRKLFQNMITQNNGLINPTSPTWVLLRPRRAIDPSSAFDWVIDWAQRKIPDHAHCHLRPCAFPGTRYWELLQRLL